MPSARESLWAIISHVEGQEGFGEQLGSFDSNKNRREYRQRREVLVNRQKRGMWKLELPAIVQKQGVRLKKGNRFALLGGVLAVTVLLCVLQG